MVALSGVAPPRHTRSSACALEVALQDIRFALRILRKNSGFAAIVLLTLAVGSGATTVMFTVINGVLLKPLPYREPDRLVILHAHSDIVGDQWFPYLNFLDFKRARRSLAPMAGRSTYERRLPTAGQRATLIAATS